MGLALFLAAVARSEIQVALVGSLLAVQVWLLAWDVSGRRGVTYAVWGAVSFSTPQVLTGVTVFPEAPAALALIYAFRHLVVRPLPAQTRRLLLVGLTLAGLPWLNPRFVLVAGCLALVAMATLWRRRPPQYTPHPSPLPAGEGAIFSLSRWEGAGARGSLLLGPLVQRGRSSW